MRTVIVLIFILLSSGILNAQQKKAEKPKFSPFYYHKVSHFRTLPNTKNEIIFLGNSITDYCEWAELFQNPNIKNRGISGDVTDGVLERLDEVTESQPAKIFIMIGINDLSRGKSEDYIFNNYKKIIKRIKKESPKTKIYIESILPVNEARGKYKNHTNKTQNVISLNRQLKTLAEESDNVQFIDLFTAFADKNQRLAFKYSLDGLHLNGDGYLVWKSIIDQYVK
jgi:lysophospholipase L1-like esterase